jgi:cytochrome b561
MQFRNSQQAYGAIAMFAHWATALCVLAAWLIGAFMDVLPRGPARGAGIFVHMSLGLAILVLAVARLAWRHVDPPPPAIAAPGLEPWLGLAAKAGHWLLYILLVATPILGIVYQFANGRALPVFGLFDIASPWVQDREFARSVREIHELSADALGLVALGHVAAACFHHWGLRDRTLTRMLPLIAR